MYKSGLQLSFEKLHMSVVAPWWSLIRPSRDSREFPFLGPRPAGSVVPKLCAEFKPLADGLGCKRKLAW